LLIDALSIRVPNKSKARASIISFYKYNWHN
jgi:hypothetical protein